MRQERRPPEVPRRLVAALAASAATGATIYLVVMGLLVPALEARLTGSHVAWLRHAFMHRPGAVLAALALVGRARFPGARRVSLGLRPVERPLIVGR